MRDRRADPHPPRRSASWAAAACLAVLVAAGVAAGKAVGATGAVPSRAGSPGASSVTTSHGTVSLVAATTGYAPGRPLELGLRFALAPGWHTYWSNPGDAGLAPDATVALDGGKPAPAAFRFPAPRRLPTGPLMGYGYEGVVLLPFTVTPPAAATSGSLAVAVHAEWLVCANVCVPETADLALALPASGAVVPSAAAPEFAASARAMPRPSPFRAVLAAGPVLRVSGEGISPESVSTAWFIPNTPDMIDQDAAQTLVVHPGELTLALKAASATPPSRLAGVLALVDRAGQETDLAIDTADAGGTPVRPEAAAAAAAHATAQAGSSGAGQATAGLGRLLVLALLGGIVLNLMPCVFPILAMKAVALGRHGGADRAGMRRSALLYTAGVLATFLAVGVVMFALRSAAGGAPAWGVQFQSPVFVAVMAWLLFAVGLNFMGMFEVGAGLGGVGQGLASRGGAFGDLMTGVLAVVVATPCTAPFMGVAVAGALAGPPLAGLAVFVALGLGLALPYLLLGVMPGAGRLIPRPGVWMDVLKQALAFPVFGACVWLVWVLAAEDGTGGVLVGGVGLVLVGLAAWLFRLVQNGVARRPGTVRLVQALSLASVILAGSLLGGLPPPGASAATVDAGGADAAMPFDAARLAALRQQGRPVFVDMSAAWCITCLVNEHIALDPPAVRDAFAHDHVALLRGDWTRRDPGITAFLHRYGRDGVPLYVFFPAGDGAPKVLPQILTPAGVLAAIGS